MKIDAHKNKSFDSMTNPETTLGRIAMIIQNGSFLFGKFIIVIFISYNVEVWLL